MVLPVLWPQLTPGHYTLFRTRLHSAFASVFASLTGPPGVRHNSFAAQPPDLLLRFYVYPWGFSLFCNLTHRLASYPVSVRRLFGFATPLLPLLPLLVAACGSLHLAVNTRGGTCTCKNRAMPGTQKKAPHDATLDCYSSRKTGSCIKAHDSKDRCFHTFRLSYESLRVSYQAA